MTDIKNYMDKLGLVPDQFLDAIRQYLRLYNETWHWNNTTLTVTNLEKAKNERT